MYLEEVHLLDIFERLFKTLSTYSPFQGTNFTTEHYIGINPQPVTFVP